MPPGGELSAFLLLIPGSSETATLHGTRPGSDSAAAPDPPFGAVSGDCSSAVQMFQIWNIGARGAAGLGFGAGLAGASVAGTVAQPFSASRGMPWNCPGSDRAGLIRER